MVAGAEWHRKLLVMILHTSSVSKMVCSLLGVKPAFNPTGVPKQHFLVTALLASHEGEPRKVAQRKLTLLYPSYHFTAGGWTSSLLQLKHQFVVASWNMRTLLDKHVGIIRKTRFADKGSLEELGSDYTFFLEKSF